MRYGERRRPRRVGDRRPPGQPDPRDQFLCDSADARQPGLKVTFTRRRPTATATATATAASAASATSASAATASAAATAATSATSASATATSGSRLCAAACRR